MIRFGIGQHKDIILVAPSVIVVSLRYIRQKKFCMRKRIYTDIGARFLISRPSLLGRWPISISISDEKALGVGMF